MTAADVIVARAGRAPFDAAIVLGTGLGPLAEAVRDAIVVSYADLPGFPATGVSGHAGRLVIGTLEGRRVAMLQGRAHVYEHGDPRAMHPALEALARHGTGLLVLTNSAGSLRADLQPGSAMAISDHIALFGPNPLIGEPGDQRFTPMNDAYDPGLRARLVAETGISEGVYAWVTGPSFETPAEIRALKALGADAVGMSTVPECILARRLGLRVLGLSMITNMAAGMAVHAPSHAETKTVATAGGTRIAEVVRAATRIAP